GLTHWKGAVEKSGREAKKRPAGDEPVHEAADAARQDLAQRPWLLVPAHQAVKMILGLLVIGGADADVGCLRFFGNSLGEIRIEQVADEGPHFQLRSSLFEPMCCQFRFFLSHRGLRKKMPFDIVRLVYIRLDDRDPGDALVAADHVQDRHAAAARADLEHMTHILFSLWL